MKHILFIGNSYTYFHDMPHSLFLPMAKEQGYDLSVTSITAGGYYLSWYADPLNPEGIRLREVLKDTHFDAIILQDQSCNPVKNPEMFMQSVGELCAILLPYTDHFLLYCTWGRIEGCPKLSELGLTSEEMTAALSRAYNAAALRYGMSVAEVGLAFEAYAKEHGQASLYDPDGSHPSPLGSRLAAEVILSALKNEGILDT